jgi:hypothetical protein
MMQTLDLVDVLLAARSMWPPAPAALLWGLNGFDNQECVRIQMTPPTQCYGSQGDANVDASDCTTAMLTQRNHN